MPEIPIIHCKKMHYLQYGGANAGNNYCGGWALSNVRITHSTPGGYRATSKLSKPLLKKAIEELAKRFKPQRLMTSPTKMGKLLTLVALEENEHMHTIAKEIVAAGRGGRIMKDSNCRWRVRSLTHYNPAHGPWRKCLCLMFHTEAL